MTELRKNHPLAYAAVAVALGMAVALLVNYLADLGIDAGFPTAFGVASAIVVKIVPIVVALAFLAATGKTGLVRPRAAGLGRGIACGALLIVMFCVMGIYAIANVVTGEAEVNVSIIVRALIYFLLVGIGEEFLARAVSAETLLEHYGLTHKGIVKACVVSGIIFGVMHIVNIFDADAASVAMQIVTTTGAGMVFGAIYFRCGNIWAGVVLHALWDASLLAATTSASFQKAAANASASSVGGGNPVGGVIFFVFLVGLSLFLLRKSKTRQVQAAWAGTIEAPADEA